VLLYTTTHTNENKQIEMNSTLVQNISSPQRQNSHAMHSIFGRISSPLLLFFNIFVVDFPPFPGRMGGMGGACNAATVYDDDVDTVVSPTVVVVI
jgi:hypothetical protein